MRKEPLHASDEAHNIFPPFFFENAIKMCWLQCGENQRQANYMLLTKLTWFLSLFFAFDSVSGPLSQAAGFVETFPLGQAQTVDDFWTHLRWQIKRKLKVFYNRLNQRRLEMKLSSQSINNLNCFMFDRPASSHSLFLFRLEKIFSFYDFCPPTFQCSLVWEACLVRGTA